MSHPGTLAGVSQIIAIHSAKGGVGKSTVAVNLAAGLAARGLRVGLLDADVHGPSAAIMLGNSEWPDPGEDETTIHPITAHGIKFISMGNMVTRETPLIWRGAMVHSVISQLFANVIWGELDYLLVDMPPGTGDAQLSISQSVPLTGAIIVSTPQELSVIDTVRGIRAFVQMKVPILGVVENMSYFLCDGCGDKAFLFGEGAGELMAEELGFPLLGKLPIEPAIRAGSDAGEPFVLAHPDSASARAMEAILARFVKATRAHEGALSFRLEWQALGWSERRGEPPAEKLSGAPISAIWQVSHDELGIQWDDGKITILGTRSLRLGCPCAACIDEFTGRPLLDPDKVPADVTVTTVDSVGRYGIQPSFSDGHRTGIYSYERLRALTR